MSDENIIDKDVARALKLLENTNVSNYEISKHTLISQSTLSNYKRNRTKPTPANARVLIDFLENENQINDVSIKASTVKPLTNPTITMIPLVSQYAYAGYLNGYGDMDYVDTLPKYPVYLDHEPTLDLYMAFEVKGDSMENGTEDSLIEGDILVCRSIDKDYWKSKLHYSKWDFVIVHKTDGIIVKRITNHDVENGVITIHSLNTFYPDKQIHLNDVTKLFSVVKTIRSRRR